MSLCFENLNRRHEILLAHLPYQLFLMVVNDYGKLNSIKSAHFFSLIKTTRWCRSEDARQIIGRTAQIIGDILKEQQSGRFKPDLATIENALQFASSLLSGADRNLFSDDLYQLICRFTKIAVKKPAETDNYDQENNLIKERLNHFFSDVPDQTMLKTRLIQLPVQIFYLVSFADGTCDKKEQKAFTKIINDRQWSHSNLVEAFFPHTISYYEQSVKIKTSIETQSNLEEIEKTIQIVTQVFDDNELHLFRRDLFTLAMEIAKASGGFMGVSKIDKQEQEVLNQLRRAFRGQTREHPGRSFES